MGNEDQLTRILNSHCVTELKRLGLCPLLTSYRYQGTGSLLQTVKLITIF